MSVSSGVCFLSCLPVCFLGCLFPRVSPCFLGCLFPQVSPCFLGCLFPQVSPCLFPRVSVSSGVSLSVSSGVCFLRCLPVSSGVCFLRCLPVCFLRCLPGPCGASASSLTGSAGKGRARAVARCWWRRSAEGRSAPSCSRKARAAASAASPTAVSLIGQSSATVQPRVGKGKGRSWRFAGVKGTSLSV